jgi:hypothetical protein
MCIENSNSGIHALVLARPADSVCAILASALCQWRHAFSVYSTVYEVVNAMKDIPAGQVPVLIVRPAMLNPQAGLFIERHFPNLRMIGWIDSGENVTDCAIAQMAVNGMVMVSHPDHLQQVIHTLCKTIPRDESVSKTTGTEFSEESDRLKYELSDDEVNALWGVE